MWGSKRVVSLVQTAPPIVSAGGQLVSVRYKRPESWRWVLWINVTQAATGGPSSLITNFSFQFGVGLDLLTIPAFETFTGVFPASPLPTLLFSSSINAPSRNTSAAPPLPQNVVDNIVAQTIQVGFNVTVSGGAPGDSYTVEVGAFFAPRTHIRPDWFVEKFAGEETGGN